MASFDRIKLLCLKNTYFALCQGLVYSELATIILR